MNIFVEFLSKISGLTFSIILYITFIFAYFFNNYYFSVNINTYGEAQIELILLTGLLVLVSYNTVKDLKELFERDDKHDEP